MHQDQNMNRPPVTFYDKIANKAVLMCVNDFPVSELKLTPFRFVGWGGRQGKDPMSVLHNVVNVNEELIRSITVTDVNEKEISTEMSFSKPIYPHGLCLILKLNKTVDGSKIKNLVIHLWKFPEENDTFVDSLDLFFKDPVTEIKYTVSPFCAQGATVQTSNRKVNISISINPQPADLIR